MNLKLNVGDLVMSSMNGLGMITKVNPVIIYVTWFCLKGQQTVDYQRSLVKEFRNLYLEYRKNHNL